MLGEKRFVEIFVKELAVLPRTSVFVPLFQTKSQQFTNTTLTTNRHNLSPHPSITAGNNDIVEGNLKLILGLIWTLILHYQIGKSKLPPKRLMLAWLQAVLPELNIRNFTTDWNNGVALSALLDYCQPGLFPNWKQLDPNRRADNCRRAMQIANQTFGIPQVLSPEDLSNPDLE